MVVMSIDPNDVLPETLQNHSNSITLNGFPMKGPNDEKNVDDTAFMENACGLVEIPPVKTELDDGSIESLLEAPVETILSMMFLTSFSC